MHVLTPLRPQEKFFDSYTNSWKEKQRNLTINVIAKTWDSVLLYW